MPDICPSVIIWFSDSNSKQLMLINLKFDRLIGLHLGWVAFEIGASQCIHVSVNILVSSLEASANQLEI